MIDKRQVHTTMQRASVTRTTLAWDSQRMLTDCGRLYYKDVEETARKAVESKEKAKTVELSTERKKTVRKAAKTGKDGDGKDKA